MSAPTQPRVNALPIAAALLTLCAGIALGRAMGVPLAGLLIMGAAGAAAVLVMGAQILMPAPIFLPAASVDSPSLPPLALHLHPGFAAFIDAQTTPLVLCADGKVLAANRAARETLGEFIVGGDVRAAIRHPAAADSLASSASDADGQTIDLVGIGQPGQRWEMRTMALADNSRLIVLTDQTGRDAVERMRADFVANASHELRTPLAAILGFVETLSEPDAGGDAALRARFLSVINTEARRMQQLVDDLIAISRIEASRAYLPDETVDLAALTRQVIGEIASGADPRATDIECTALAPAPVRGDRAQLSQMLHNIIGNAMKYGRAGTPVSITLATDANSRSAGVSPMAELIVRDVGDGIAADHIPRLTERFYRVDSARSRALGGTGLGLSIVKHVVERHKGRLEIDSVQGSGTYVHIRLPVCMPAK